MLQIYAQLILKALHHYSFVYNLKSFILFHIKQHKMDYKIGFVCTLLIILCNAFPDGAPPDTCKLILPNKQILNKIIQ